MAIKVEVIANKKEEILIEYPYLGISLLDKKVIVFFTKKNTGFQIESDYLTYRETWNEHNFEKLEGQITLSND